MISKEKMQFIERFNRLQSVKEFEERLKDQPLYVDELAELGYDVVSKNNSLVKELKELLGDKLTSIELT